MVWGDADVLDAQPPPLAIHVAAHPEPGQLGAAHGRAVGRSGNVSQHFVVRAAFLDDQRDVAHAGGKRPRGGGARLEAVRLHDEGRPSRKILRLGDWKHRKGTLAPLAAAERSVGALPLGVRHKNRVAVDGHAGGEPTHGDVAEDAALAHVDRADRIDAGLGDQ